MRAALSGEYNWPPPESSRELRTTFSSFARRKNWVLLLALWAKGERRYLREPIHCDTAERRSQQPRHAISAGSPWLHGDRFSAQTGADTRSLARMSALGLDHEFAKVGTVRGGGQYPITCENVRVPVRA